MTSNPSSLEAVAVEGYFIVGEEALLRCIEQRSGRIGQSRDFGVDQGYVPLALCGYGRNALVWTRESIHVVHSLSIPSLEKKLLFYTDSYAATTRVIGDVLIGNTIGRTEAYNILTGKKLWSGGQWNWSNDADNYILYSEMASGGKTATVNEIQLKTGMTRKLYEEPLPPPSNR